MSVVTTTEKRPKGKPRCEHGDSSPRNANGECRTCHNIRQRAKYHADKALMLDRATKALMSEPATEKERTYQFYQGRGFVRAGSDWPISMAYYVESQGGKKLWPEGVVLCGDFAEARSAAHAQANATGHPVFLVRREIQNRDVINEVRTEVRLTPPAPGAILAGARGKAVSS